MFQKNVPFSHHTFFGHSLVGNADSFEVIPNIKRDDQPLLITKIHWSFKIYTCNLHRVSQETRLCLILPFYGTLNSSFSNCKYWTRWSTYVFIKYSRFTSVSKVIQCPKMTNYGTKTRFWGHPIHDFLEC